MYLQNYKIWKQFTTSNILFQNRNLLNVSAKLQNLKAIHNASSAILRTAAAECICKITKSESNSQPCHNAVSACKCWMYLQNYKIWKQFTTHPRHTGASRGCVVNCVAGSIALHDLGCRAVVPPCGLGIANLPVSWWLIANLPEQCRIAPLFARIRLTTHADCANLADLFVGRLFHWLDTY